MVLNQKMTEVVCSIQGIESAHTGKQLNVSANQLGNRLIVLYYKTRNITTRELITQFMAEAGAVWERKLIAGDIGPIASSQESFASLTDYLDLLAANDAAQALYR